MVDGIVICEICGNPMTYFQEAHTCGWMCTVCGDGVATSYFEPILTDIVDYHVILVSADKSLTSIKATPHKDRLTALHAIFRQIFRHFRQNLLEIRQYYKKLCSKSDAQSLCGVALKQYRKMLIAILLKLKR